MTCPLGGASVVRANAALCAEGSHGSFWYGTDIAARPPDSPLVEERKTWAQSEYFAF